MEGDLYFKIVGDYHTRILCFRQCLQQARSEDFVMGGYSGSGGLRAFLAIFTFFNKNNVFLGIFRLKFLL